MVPIYTKSHERLAKMHDIELPNDINEVGFLVLDEYFFDRSYHSTRYIGLLKFYLLDQTRLIRYGYSSDKYVLVSGYQHYIISLDAALCATKNYFVYALKSER